MSDSLSEESLCAFLDHLAETSNVSVSARRAGVSRSAVYRLRATCPAFSRGWQMAIATGYDELEFRMLKTARFGTIKPVKRPDGSIGRATEFDDAQGLKLLMAYKQSAEKTRSDPPAEPQLARTARDQLAATLEQIRQRLDGSTKDDQRSNDTASAAPGSGAA
ncbi:hypothetical protein C7451_103235 [Blastomonas natatoria]|uniref:Uncharacterized protein n=1 Tax=Blastomonas natatoria TaxID=34015 RepID=A0A2V3V904_9SPHN|nr:hypothetical protein [Blastomonas natatoria]PXW78127.1 hypothetical protein C7451_103235 [Blastomonas natatoria]